MDAITKLKISKKLKGRKKSATHIRKIKEALTGRKLDKNHKKHISESMKRKPADSPINKQTISTPFLIKNTP